MTRVRCTPGVMGGDACIRDTRIPVWLLVSCQRQGMSDGELLRSCPVLNASDLAAAWDYEPCRSQRRFIAMQGRMSPVQTNTTRLNRRE